MLQDVPFASRCDAMSNFRRATSLQFILILSPSPPLSLSLSLSLSVFLSTTRRWQVKPRVMTANTLAINFYGASTSTGARRWSRGSGRKPGRVEGS